jgi:hypothetical protein
MIPENIIFCNEEDNISIFEKKIPYKISKKIHYVAKGHVFVPPFFKIIILFETINITNDQLRLLWNMTLSNGFLIIPKNYFNELKKIIKNMSDFEYKNYHNYIMIKKSNGLIITSNNIKYREAVDFGIYGVQKGGTTAAVRNISKHPELFVYTSKNLNSRDPANDEIHFFDIFWYKGIEWYKKHFDYTKKLVGDKNPDLMYLSECFPLITSVNPFIKMIFILRNPINRAYSEYKMLKTRWGETKTFEELINEELKYRMDEPTNLYNSALHIIQRGLYFKQIKKLLKYFPRENMIFLISEKVRKNMENEYNKIFRFLGVKELYGMEYTEEYVGSSDNDYKKYLSSETYNIIKNLFESDILELENFLNIKTDWVI